MTLSACCHLLPLVFPKITISGNRNQTGVHDEIQANKLEQMELARESGAQAGQAQAGFAGQLFPDVFRAGVVRYASRFGVM